MISPLLQTVARALLPLALLVAVDLLLRGHNLPGGGFVAGLMTAVALILQFVAADRRVAERGLPCRPETLIWVGLACAGGTAVGALLLGYPLLTSAFGHVEVPLLGHFEASTAFAILIAIEE
jgi:multicomponent K+:H+ antiporter subunit A